MKTYALDSYKETFGACSHPDDREGWERSITPFCNCVSAIMTVDRYLAFDDCRVCLGYGLYPIDMQDVR